MFVLRFETSLDRISIYNNLGVDAKVTSIRRLKPHDIQTDPVLPKEVTLLSEKIGLKTQTELREELGQKLQSEGYETMTQYSSDIVSEVKQTNQFGVPIFVVTRLRNVYSQ